MGVSVLVRMRVRSLTNDDELKTHQFTQSLHFLSI